jgi:hypothetical protein
MSVTWTPDQEAWLKTEIAKGRFATPEDAISFAINEMKWAARRVAKVLKALPKGFPEELVNSKRVAAIHRLGLLSDIGS